MTGDRAGSWALGYNKLGGEHKLCKSLQDKPGPDCHLREQTYTWISHLDDQDDMIYELGVDGDWDKIQLHQPRDDLQQLLKTMMSDAHHAIYHWWDYPFTRTECLVRYIEDCKQNKLDPFQLYFCGVDNASKYTPSRVGNENEEVHPLAWH